MCDCPRGVKIIELCPHSVSEYGTLNARNVACNHCGLVYPIQNPRHRREEIWLEDLCILEQSKGITREETDSAANSDHSQLINSLYDAL